MKFEFDNGVQVVFSPYSDNFGQSWEESCVCYPVLGDWQLVINFEVDENNPVEEWEVNYVGTHFLRDGKHGSTLIVDHKLVGTTLKLALPDEGLYVKRVWGCMMASNQVDLASEECWSIGEGISQLEYQLQDLTKSSGRRQALFGELASLRDELDKATDNLEGKQAEHERLYGEDPTFELIDD